MQRKNGYYLEYISKITPSDVLPGVTELLEALRNAGIRIAVASSSRNAGMVLRGLDLDAMIDVVCDGSMVGAAKPAPDIFLCAAEQLGLDPAVCVVVEDADVGVLAARAAGMRVIGLGSPALVGGADAVFSSLDHVSLPDLLSIT
jgi:kojibiose phosphorylase